MFRKSVKKIQVSLTSETNTFHEDQRNILIISRSLLRMRNISDKSFREN